MATDDRFTLLTQAIAKLKADGVQSVRVDALLDYIAKPEAAVESRPDPSAAEIEQCKAQLAAWVEKQKEVSAINVEGFKSVILAGQSALRSALLVNGGAAVALLAFIGKLSTDSPGDVGAFARPLLVFVAGALTVTINAGLTYLGQWFYFGGGGWRWKVGFTLNILSIVVAMLSYILFAVGAWLAYRAFAAYA